MEMIVDEEMVADTRNSFVASSDLMKTGDMFDVIITSCQFPEFVPVTYLQLLNSWLEGKIYDAVFIDFVIWHTPSLVGVTKCLIGAYVGGMI